MNKKSTPIHQAGDKISVDHVLTEVEVIRPHDPSYRGHYRGQCKCEFHFDASTYWDVVRLFRDHLTNMIPAPYLGI